MGVVVGTGIGKDDVWFGEASSSTKKCACWWSYSPKAPIAEPIVV